MKENSLNITDIDHLMVRVADLDKVAGIYERFGFFVCPPRRKIAMTAYSDGVDPGQDAPKATLNNRHIIFQPYPGRTDVANFLEFMCIEDQLATPTKVTLLLAFLQDSEGPKTIVCATPDIDKSADGFRARGFEVPQTIPFETGWDDEERGKFVRIQARPCVPVMGQMPFFMNCFETSTLENYRYTPWTKHPNTARYMSGVTGVTDRIKEHTTFMAERVFDVEPDWIDDDIAVLRPRDIFLRIVTPEGFRKLFGGLDYSTERVIPHTAAATFAVESLDTLRGILEGNAVDYVTTDSGLCIARQHACNTLLEFVAMD